MTGPRKTTLNACLLSIYHAPVCSSVSEEETCATIAEEECDNHLKQKQPTIELRQA